MRQHWREEALNAWRSLLEASGGPSCFRAGWQCGYTHNRLGQAIESLTADLMGQARNLHRSVVSWMPGLGRKLVFIKRLAWITQDSPFFLHTLHKTTTGNDNFPPYSRYGCSAFQRGSAWCEGDSPILPGGMTGLLRQQRFSCLLAVYFGIPAL